MNPGGRENTATVRIQSRGDLTRLRLTFAELNEPVFLISVTLNARQPLAIHWLRVFLLTGFLAALFLALRFRLYAQDYQPDRRSHRLLNLGVLLLALFISAGILYGSDASHQLLRPYPTLERFAPRRWWWTLTCSSWTLLKRGRLSSTWTSIRPWRSSAISTIRASGI